MSVQRVIFASLFACLMMGASWTVSGFAWQTDNELLVASEVFVLEPAEQHGDEFVIEGEVSQDYYLYRRTLSLMDAEGNEVELALPEGTSRYDEFFGDSEVYTGGPLPLRFSAEVQSPLMLRWQGCADMGFCYPPQTISVSLPGVVSKTPADEPPTGVADTAPQDVAEDQRAAERLSTLGPVAGALLFLGFGLLLAFTPCTLPMIPIISGMIVGSQAPPRRAMMLSLAYVLAMASTYAVVGVIAGLAGANLQGALQSPWLLGGLAGLFLVLAASLFGLFELQLPSALVSRLNAAGAGQKGGSLTGAGLLGLISALLVGPCMTAPLAGALLYIGQTGSAVIGGVALFALGLGMGLPLLLIAVFGARFLPCPGAWMERVRIVFGFVMSAMAVVMLSRFLPAGVGLLLWGIWGVSVVCGLLALAQVVAQRPRLVWGLRFLASLLGIWALFMLLGAASGGSSVLRPLEHLRQVSPSDSSVGYDFVNVKSVEDVDEKIAEAGGRGQWTMIDFYADWCVSCHVIERHVFGDPAVSSRLGAMQVLRPDVTRNDAIDQALMRRWQVLGPPTIILIAPDGSERRAQRTIGEVNVQNFIARLNAAGVP